MEKYINLKPILEKSKYISNDSTKNMKIIIQTYKLHLIMFYNKSIRH